MDKPLFTRHIDIKIQNHFNKFREILILLGARQTGKTTLLKKIFPQASYFLLDNEPIKALLESYDINTYKQFLPSGTSEIIFDEAHLLSDPGRAFKIMYDQIPDIKLIITGSSALNIKNKATESLAGRFIEYHLLPLTFSEYLTQTGIETANNYKILDKIESQDTSVNSHVFDLQQTLETILCFGQYPNVINYPRNTEYLNNLANTLIFKDIEKLSLIEKRSDAAKLLKALAYQIGQLINYSELALKVGINQQTIKRYIDIFEQSFIIFRLYPYSQDKRIEISKMPKIYFYDLGIRNALIGDFSTTTIRRDSGSIFENFIINEIRKINTYQDKKYNIYFWRTKTGSEVDIVLENATTLYGIEVKSGQNRSSGLKAFANKYKQAKIHIVTKENFY